MKRSEHAKILSADESLSAQSIIEKFDLPCSARAVQRWRKRKLGDGTYDEESAPQPGDRTYRESDGEATVEVVTEQKIRTLEELLDVCDMDSDVWRVKDWECRTWTTAMKLRTPGKHGTEDEPYTAQNYLVKARFERKLEEMALREVFDKLIEDFQRISPAYIERSYDAGKHLLVLCIPDPHFGKQADGWSLEQALSVHTSAVDALLSQTSGFDIERIWTMLGNDGSHIDDVKGRTTKGTQMDYIATWRDNLRAVTNAHRLMIDRSLEVSPVDVTEVPGNHDWHAAFHEREVIRAWYKDNPHVQVDESDHARKYYRYGCVLLGATHGKNEKSKDLPMIMAHERKKDWAETSYREWHTGHLHHRRKSTALGDYEEVDGVIVRMSPALCPPDEWHEIKGFIGSMRAAEAYVYNQEGGLVAQFHYNVHEN